jgi:ectoine hydroxylase-related dioxygenase (phytanoyl-CoA dioxygenase family)
MSTMKKETRRSSDTPLFTYKTTRCHIPENQNLSSQCSGNLNTNFIPNFQPGDCVVFHMRTVHGAAGNSSVSHQRRVLATRWLGKFHVRTVHMSVGNSSVFHHRCVLPTRWLGKFHKRTVHEVAGNSSVPSEKHACSEMAV